MRHAATAVLALLALPGAAAAATLGLPILTTAPATVSVVNQFDGSLPTPSYTLSVTTTIATASGAPELVGQGLAFSFFVNGGFDDGTVPSSLSIAGIDVLTDPLFNENRVLITPPFTETIDPITLEATFTYEGVFAGFGPRTAEVPDIELEWALNQALPFRTGYIYCEVADPSACEFSNDAGLTEIGGEPVFVDASLEYPEGTVDGGTLTFSTVGGRPPAPVPLPAGAWLLAGALGGLLALGRARRAA